MNNPTSILQTTTMSDHLYILPETAEVYRKVVNFLELNGYKKTTTISEQEPTNEFVVVAPCNSWIIPAPFASWDGKSFIIAAQAARHEEALYKYVKGY